MQEVMVWAAVGKGPQLEGRSAGEGQLLGGAATREAVGGGGLTGRREKTAGCELTGVPHQGLEGPREPSVGGSAGEGCVGQGRGRVWTLPWLTISPFFLPFPPIRCVVFGGQCHSCYENCMRGTQKPFCVWLFLFHSASAECPERWSACASLTRQQGFRKSLSLAHRCLGTARSGPFCFLSCGA